MVALPKCINCAACNSFAPETFDRSASTSSFHVVKQQPSTEVQILQARAALAACPVAAIRVETKAERRHRAIDKDSVEQDWRQSDEDLVKLMALNDKNGLKHPFPRPFLEQECRVSNVYWTGYHNEASFGATPYLFKTSHKGKDTWIMVDTPRHSIQAVRAVTSLTGIEGPDYMFLTHIDDTADHGKWAQEFPNLKRIFHSGDLGRYNWIGDKTLEQVEVLLPNQARSGKHLLAYTLDGETLPDDWFSSEATHPVVILHTPGHSPGSITLYKLPNESEPGVLFTGDTYAFTSRDGGRMTGFPRYGRDLRLQSESIRHFLELDWDVIAPGHGHPRDYREIPNKSEAQMQEMQVAIEELQPTTFAGRKRP